MSWTMSPNGTPYKPVPDALRGDAIGAWVWYNSQCLDPIIQDSATVEEALVRSVNATWGGSDRAYDPLYNATKRKKSVYE